MNIGLLLEMAAATLPERVAVSAADRHYTYRQVLNAARAAARRFGSGNYRYIALLDSNSVAVPVAMFGAALAGIPYVPLNYRLTAPELEALLARIEPACLIGGREPLQALRLPAAIATMPRDEFVDVMFAAHDEPPLPEPQPGGTAIQLFTSGTTGKPKAAVLSHDNLMAYILGTVEFGAAAESDALLVAVPPYHIAGISAVLSSTYACRRLVQLANFDALEWLRLCRGEAVSNAFLVPTMLTRIIDQLDAGDDGAGARQLPALRALAYGGGKMPQSVIERALRLFPGVDFTNAYGLTETSSTICLLDPDDHRAALASADAAVRRRLGSVGTALGTIELQVRGDDGSVLAALQPGDVYVRGGQVAGAYLDSGSLLDADGWFPTRDRGFLDAGGYLFLEGRADDVIVRGGENISPGEIEDVLLEHPAVIDAAVVAVPSEQWGESVAAAVVLGARSAATAAELQQWVRARLRSSRVPEAITFSEQLPYNEMGKLLRRVIRQQFIERLARGELGYPG